MITEQDWSREYRTKTETERPREWETFWQTMADEARQYAVDHPDMREIFTSIAADAERKAEEFKEMSDDDDLQ